MNLAWCMIVLAIAGADDQKYRTPPAGIAPVATEVKPSEMSERWPMDLAQATHIAFDNSENFRIVEFGVSGIGAFFPVHTDGLLTIARLNAGVRLPEFKADAMALVRSVERAYWNLVQAQVVLESTEHAASMARDVYHKAGAEPTPAHCDALVAGLAEAAPRLEQFSIDLKKRKADVTTAERSLRTVLGLPSADGRRIVATTKPADELISFDWDTCVEEMSREQPENARERAVVRLAELRLLVARNQWIPLLDAPALRQLTRMGPVLDTTEAACLAWLVNAFRPLLNLTADRVEGIDPIGKADLDSSSCATVLTLLAPEAMKNPLASTRQARYILLRTRARQRQVLDQTTHSLARSFVEVDDTFIQFTAAKRLEAAAAHRLAAQRASFDQDRIALDRLLDAFNQHAEAIAAAARHQTAYNIAVAALSEAKGTLLADRNIVVSDGPTRVRSLQIVQTNATPPDTKRSPCPATAVARWPAQVPATPLLSSFLVVTPETPTARTSVNSAQTPERWPMDLDTATRTAFDNSEDCRLIQFGVGSFEGVSFYPLDHDGPIRIARGNADGPLAKFKADAMTLVRSVEKAYWNLARAQLALESTEPAASMARDVFEKAQAELTPAHCDPLVADLAEAAPRLEQLLIDLEKRRADVMTAERSLRTVLGLPPADDRRIIATTKPIEELISFDWNTCVEEMSREQPENIEQHAIGRLAELSLFLARHHVIPLMAADTKRQLECLGPLLDSTEAVWLGQCLKAFRPLISASLCVEGIDLGGNVYMDSLTWHRYLVNQVTMGRGSMANTRLAQYVLLRARTRQRQVFEQTVQSLSRCFVDVDDTFQQFTVAKRLEVAAAHRLAVQRASYDENRISLDRLLDAIDQNAQAIAAAARHQATYSVALAALGEAKGTLLADRDITIAEGPKRVRPIAVKTTEPISIGSEPPKRGEIGKSGGVRPGTTATTLFSKAPNGGDIGEQPCD